MPLGRLVLAVSALALVALAVMLFSGGADGLPADPSNAPATGGSEPEPGGGVPTVPTGSGGSGGSGGTQDPAPRGVARGDFADLLAELEGRGAIAGYVRTAAGEGVPDALVWLIHPDDDDEILDARTTDGRGRFLFGVGFDDESHLRFRVAAHDPSRGLSAVQTVDRPGAGALALIELVATWTVGSISGRVLGPAGGPVPDHPVLLVRIDEDDPESPEWRGGRDDAEVRTGADGAFIARGLRPGTFEVDADPRDEPAGLLGADGVERPEARTDGPLVTVELPWVRVDVLATDGAGGARGVDEFRLNVFAAPMAELAAARHAAGLPLEPPEVAATALRTAPGVGGRATFWVAPGCWVLAEAVDGPQHGQVDGWIARDRAVQEFAIERGTEGRAVLVLHVVTADGAAVEEIVLRAAPINGTPFVPEGTVDLGDGFVRTANERLILPATNLRLTILGEPLRTSRRHVAGAYLPATIDLALAPGSETTREVRLVRAALLELEAVCEASALRGTEPNRFAGRIGGLAVLRANAAVERADGELEPLLLGALTPGSDTHYAELAGLPWASDTTTRARALRALRPGPGVLSVTSWRGAVEDGDGAEWPIELIAGVNRFRVRVDADGIVHFLGR